ncbi:penicillin acylase family protein [Nocardioides sp. LHG3406-4]|uniref:penicillin acylase family protein n=1 Tax=Nocardioides sp. LHG3406-4 TaxID=2804575 RepID=UPI003CF8B3A2
MSQPTNKSIVVPGLSDPVEILIDTWGVPHIYAANDTDAFFAQGFNAARDRLFHIDLWRRRGLGRLSEVFGESHIERDRAARLFLYRGDMRAEWLAYGTDTKEVASAFVAGVNAFVTLAREDDSFLPVEFKELGYDPSLWEPSDVARIRSHGLYYNLEEEVARAFTIRDFGPEVEDLRRVREPYVELKVPEGLDLDLIPDDVLHVYRLATTPPDLSDPSAALRRRTEPEGSNNWVIGSSRTHSGRPLLADDPHRVVSLPGLRYIAHLKAPGLDVIGAGEPALPGVSIGHNGHVAFGLTIFAIDQEDLYVYKTNPENPREYWYEERWVPMTEVRETIEVAGSDPVEASMHYTRHGPVIHEDPDRHTACAVRAAWLQPGMAPYLGSMDYMRAATPQAFVSAMNRWGAPGENQVYAAPDGTIGWKPAGLVPVRPNWDGTMPVPGDGRYEWAGFYDGDQLPADHAPDVDWFATANQMNLPADYPQDRTITHDWYAGVRYERIAEELSARHDWTVGDCVQLQNDYLSVPARYIVERLGTVSEVPVDVAAAVELLAEWDYRLEVDSAAAALFEIWYRRHLRPALLEQALTNLVPAERRQAALDRILPKDDLAADCRIDLRLLGIGDHDAALEPKVVDRLMIDSLAGAVTAVEELLGTDREAWRWGSLHQALLRHPQAALLGDNHREWTSVGPVARGGSGDTVGCTTYSPDFVQTVGASFRIVVDVGEWDNSVAMNSPGQSGDPVSPHFRDLFGVWAEGGSFPLLYSRNLIEENLSEVITLRPPVQEA